MTDRTKILIAAILVILVGVVAWKILAGGDFRHAGTVEAVEVDLSARTATVVSSYFVKEGEPVSAGQTLVSLSCDDLRLALSAARTDFNRAERLYKSGVMPFDAYDHLRVKRDDLEIRVNWCTVTSPIDGRVMAVYHEPAEWVTPGTKLLTVGDLSEVWAYFFVPQTSLVSIAVGMPVTGLLAERKETRFEGRVTHIADKAEFTPKNVQTRSERTRLVYRVKVTFPNTGGVLKPGMTLEAKLPD
jgi:HlyD family secretion protein